MASHVSKCMAHNEGYKYGHGQFISDSSKLQSVGATRRRRRKGKDKGRKGEEKWRNGKEKERKREEKERRKEKKKGEEERKKKEEEEGVLRSEHPRTEKNSELRYKR